MGHKTEIYRRAYNQSSILWNASVNNSINLLVTKGSPQSVINNVSPITVMHLKFILTIGGNNRVTKECIDDPKEYVHRRSAYGYRVGWLVLVDEAEPDDRRRRQG